jgi:hypothetical protein
MTDDLKRLLSGVRLVEKGATDEQIARAEAEMDCELPGDVKALLREHDGGTGTLGPHKRPFELWSIERIADECEAQEVTRAVPGVVLFGSDGGSEGYGWFPQAPRKKYGRISLIAAGPHEFEGLGDSLLELVDRLAAS